MVRLDFTWEKPALLSVRGSCFLQEPCFPEVKTAEGAAKCKGLRLLKGEGRGFCPKKIHSRVLPRRPQEHNKARGKHHESITSKNSLFVDLRIEIRSKSAKSLNRFIKLNSNLQ